MELTPSGIIRAMKSKTLKKVGIDESRIDEMARHVAETAGLEDAWVPLTEADIAAIFRASL